ncbi:hypothetical protein FIA58_008675 [Flavobacterium jejuense]|uniref:VWFA domain-containing protein n=1 Tax=Flavobacterium jejuense TaxID=1544455 RepID=A0ABX0IQ98_9FLAO|nr:ribosomal protein L7/L12 [Flavobacterium jejuense]NHN25746.1 hypothetical protein [Flavobacterium jejuense]
MDFKKYFQQYHDYFWYTMTYKDDFEDDVVVFDQSNNGSTIAYKNYVTEVLELLSDDCIPPFGSLLLAIVATNPNSEALLVTLHHYAKSKERASSFPNANLYRTGAAFDFLKILASLPEEYKAGDNRILLFKTIFEKCHNRVGSEIAKKIINDFKEVGTDYAERINVIPFNEANFIKDFRTIALLKQKFPNKESLLKALTALPEPEKIEEVLAEEVSQPLESNKTIDFVEELIQEQKTFQVGSLLQRIWSGLNIPFHHNVPSQQPIGGVSDLTNKGDFDKLLLSEFANDDLVFMSRLANNEALYIQREIPPQDNKKVRVLLLDVSLKNWGNPKIVTFATALAIAKHPKTDIECVVYAFGKEYTPVKIDTVNQVITSLQELSGGLDGGEGLQQYFEKEYGSLEEVELFVFTQEENFESIPFTKVINEHFDKINFIITTTASGVIDTYKIKNKVRKHIKKIQLPLDELWSNPPKPRTRAKAMRSNSQSEIPILYPVERNYSSIFHYESVFYMFINSNLFVFQDQPLTKGFEKITSSIPFTKGQFTIFKNKMGALILVNWIAEEKRLSFYDLEQKTTISKEITINTELDLKLFSKEQNVYFSDDDLFYKISDTFDCIVTSHEAVKDYFKQYSFKNNQFVRDFKHTSKTYVVMNNLKTVRIKRNRTEVSQYNQNSNDIIQCNKYALQSNTFLEYYGNRLDSYLVLEMRVTLVLKKANKNQINIIKFLKENFNYGLGEAKMMVDDFNKVIVENIANEEAQKYKTDLENLGATCYIEITHFITKDGSSVSCNNGILTLESSNTNIPKMYIPFITNFPSAMATDNDFTGNPHFLPEESNLNVIDTQDFHDKYYKPFIQHIIEHEANVTTA